MKNLFQDFKKFMDFDDETIYSEEHIVSFS